MPTATNPGPAGDTATLGAELAPGLAPAEVEHAETKSARPPMTAMAAIRGVLTGDRIGQ